MPATSPRPQEASYSENQQVQAYGVFCLSFCIIMQKLTGLMSRSKEYTYLKVSIFM